MKKNKIKVLSLAIISLFIMSSFVGCNNKNKYDTTINFLNWGENIADGLIEEFQEKYNIGVNQILLMTMKKCIKNLYQEKLNMM